MKGKRHLSVVPDPSAGETCAGIENRWPTGTVTALMDVLGSGEVMRGKDPAVTCRKILEALEKPAQQREVHAVHSMLNELEIIHGNRLTVSQRNLMTWLRNRSLE